MKKQEMVNRGHVLVFPYPVQGHINPMLQFSKRLASKGLKVTVLITTAAFAGKFSMEQQSGLSIIFMEAVSTSPSQDQGKNVTSILDRFKGFRDRMLEKLPHVIAEQGNSGGQYPVSCLVYDSVVPWALDIAKQLGLAGASFFTQSCAVSAVYCKVHEGELRIPIEDTYLSLPGLPSPLSVCDLPSFVYQDLEKYPTILDSVVAQFSNVDTADWIFFNTFTALEEEAVNWMASKWPIKPIGPTIPSMFLDKRLEDDRDYGVSLFNPNSDVCMKWLDSKQPRSVVYVSFGSLAALGEEQMAELAMGLKSSDCHFLWVVRESEEKKLPPNLENEISSENGLVIGWSPQLEVLAHKSVGCFLTHCGWNSTLEALSLGVPVVAMPQWTDQPTNAKFVADVWGVGLKVKVNEKGMVTKEEIAYCIKEVMAGEDKREEIRRNSDKLKELAKKAVDVGGSSDRNIDEFVSRLAGVNEYDVPSCC